MYSSNGSPAQQAARAAANDESKNDESACRLSLKPNRNHTLPQAEGEPTIPAAPITSQSAPPKGREARTTRCPQQPAYPVKPEMTQAATPEPQRGGGERPKRKKNVGDSTSATLSPEPNLQGARHNQAQAADKRPMSGINRGTKEGNDTKIEVPVAGGNNGTQNAQDVPEGSQQKAIKRHQVGATAQHQQPLPVVSTINGPAERPAAHRRKTSQSCSPTASQPPNVEGQHRTRNKAAGVKPAPGAREETRRYNTRKKGLVKKEG